MRQNKRYWLGRCVSFEISDSDDFPQLVNVIVIVGVFNGAINRLPATGRQETIITSPCPFEMIPNCYWLSRLCGSYNFTSGGSTGSTKPTRLLAG